MKVGRTVPTVREAIEEELERWKEFKESLRKDEREAFERMVEGCEKHISAISQAKRPEPFQALVMTVLLDQEKRLETIEEKLQEIEEEAGGG